MFLFFLILALSVVLCVIHLLFSKKRISSLRTVELLLLYQLVFNVGILGFLSFIGLTFMAEEVAKYNDWQMSLFQQEMANVNLAFGILGILCIWIRGLFWTATSLGASIWLFADGINHLYDMLFNHNFSRGNTGILVFSDLALPICICTLLFFYHKLRNEIPSQKSAYGSLGT